MGRAPVRDAAALDIYETPDGKDGLASPVGGGGRAQLVIERGGSRQVMWDR